MQASNRVLITGVKQSGQTFLSAFNTSFLSRYHLAASWPTGSMVLWIGVILGGYLLFDVYF